MPLKVLLVVHHVEQARDVVENRPDLLTTHEVLCLTLDAAAYLESKGFSFSEPDDFFTIDELRSIRMEAQELMSRWFEPFGNLFDYRSFSIARLNQQEWYYFFQDVLFASRFFYRLHEKKEALAFMLFRSPRRPAIFHRTSDVFEPVWEFLAQSKQLPVQYIDPKVTAQKGVKSHSFFLSPIAFGRNWIRNLGHLIGRKRPDVIFMMGLGEVARFGRIYDRLREHLGERIQAMRSAPIIVPHTRTAGGNEVSSLRSWFPGKGYLLSQILFAQRWRRWKKIQASYDGIFPEIFANPFLDFHFKYYFQNRWPILCEYIDEALSTLKQLKPRLLAITCIGAVDHGSLFVEVARKLGIRTVGFPHAVVPETGLFPLLESDYHFLWSNEFLASGSRYETMKSSIVGIPQDEIFEAFAHMESPGKRKADSSSDSVKSILVLTSPPGLVTLPELKRKAHREMIYRLANIPKTLRGNVKVIFKVHPGEDSSDLYRFAQKREGTKEVSVVGRTPLRELIAQVDLCILVDIPTTALYLCLFQKKRILYIHSSQCFVASALPFVKFSEKAVVHNLEQVWPRIHEVLSDPQKGEELQREHEAFLKRWVLTAENPIQNIHMRLEKLIKAAPMGVTKNVRN